MFKPAQTSRTDVIVFVLHQKQDNSNAEVVDISDNAQIKCMMGFKC